MAAERVRKRYVFQVESCAERTVLRVRDGRGDEVLKEIPIEEFLAYAREHRDVRPFLLDRLHG